MVALLVRLKLTLLRNSLRRSVWRTVGLVIGAVYGLGVVAAVVAGLVALRWTSIELTADVTVVAFAGLSIGWLLLSLLVFGVDETVDPARFALLPVRARELLPGLLAAAMVGVPGVATVLVGLGLVVTWARSLPLTVAALLAMLLGVVSCVLLARAATSALAAVLASRRFRDLAVVGVVLLSVVFALGGNVLGQLVDTDPERLRAALGAVAWALGWSPFGWAWAVPADVARGDWLVAGIHLMLAAGLVAGLWWGWAYALDRRLTSPVEQPGDSRPVKESGWVDRVFPETPAGGVAARTLRYWRRDPRYLAGVAGFLVGPVILIVLQLINPMANGLVAVFAPTLVGLLVGLSLAQDLSYDGSALWLHCRLGPARRRRPRRPGLVRAGGLPADDPDPAAGQPDHHRELRPWPPRRPLSRWARPSPDWGSVRWSGRSGSGPPRRPAPTRSPSSNQGGLPSLLSVTVTTFATLLVSLPTLALVVWSIFTPWVGRSWPLWSGWRRGWPCSRSASAGAAAARAALARGAGGVSETRGRLRPLQRFLTWPVPTSEAY